VGGGIQTLKDFTGRGPRRFFEKNTGVGKRQISWAHGGLGRRWGEDSGEIIKRKGKVPQNESGWKAARGRKGKEDRGSQGRKEEKSLLAQANEKREKAKNKQKEIGKGKKCGNISRGRRLGNRGGTAGSRWKKN